MHARDALVCTGDAAAVVATNQCQHTVDRPCHALELLIEQLQVDVRQHSERGRLVGSSSTFQGGGPVTHVAVPAIVLKLQCVGSDVDLMLGRQPSGGVGAFPGDGILAEEIDARDPVAERLQVDVPKGDRLIGHPHRALASSSKDGDRRVNLGDDRLGASGAAHGDANRSRDLERIAEALGGGVRHEVGQRRHGINADAKPAPEQ